MKIKTCWVEQVSKSDQPYMLHCTMTKDGRKLAVSCDLYAEWIDNENHRLYIPAQSTAEKFVAAVVEKCINNDVYPTKDDIHAMREELKELQKCFTN